jgi:hypothetical protein
LTRRSAATIPAAGTSSIRSGSSSRSLAVEIRHLLRGLLDVAEVGHEAPHVPADDGEAVRAREPGDVAQVDEVVDEQQVELALGEPARDAVRPAHSSALSRSSASR